MRILKSKNWLWIWTSCLLIIAPIVGGINFYIDPLWMFSHANNYNRLQIPFNEKKMKARMLLRTDTPYNGILIGSSRTTFYDQNEFIAPIRPFNFAFADGKPFEYQSFIDFYREHSNKELKYIIIGFDFFDSLLKKDENQPQLISENQQLLEEVQNVLPLYFVQNYFSIDMLEYALKNASRSVLNKPYHSSYDRNNIVRSGKSDKDQVTTLAKRRASVYYKYMQGYDPNFRDMLEKLTSSNKDQEFIIFTTLLSEPFLLAIYQDKKLTEFYFRWLRDLVAVFDRVYFMTFYHNLAKTYAQHCNDGDHYYPYIGKHVTQMLKQTNYADEYGVADSTLLIDKNNIEQQIQHIKSLIPNISAK